MSSPAPSTVTERYCPPDPIGRATHTAQRLAWRMLFSLLGWDAHLRYQEQAQADCQRGMARDAWPNLVRAMDALAELAPFSAEDGAALDARMQDWLETRPHQREISSLGVVTHAAIVTGCVSAHLRAANAEGISRRERVEALTRAFRAWPSACRAVARMSDETAFSARAAA